MKIMMKMKTRVSSWMLDNMVNMMTLTTKSLGDSTTSCWGGNSLWETRQSCWGGNPVSRRPSSQVAGVETQDSVSRRTSSQVAGVETQDSVSRRPGSQVAGGETQNSVSGKVNIAQPPYFLEQQNLTINRMAHFYKINSGSTERLLLRNSSKDTENSDKNFRKEVKAPEVIDKLKEVSKLWTLRTQMRERTRTSGRKPRPLNSWTS